VADASTATTRIVDAEWLRTHLADPDVVVVELAHTPAGEAESPAARPEVVPGARRAHWKDLLWHRSRREFPSARELAERLHALGARSSSTVVFAGDPPQFAAYALWVAEAVGLGGDLRYLDGGLPAWAEADRAPAPGPRARAVASPSPGEDLLPQGAPRTGLVAGRDEVRAAIGTATVLLDLRSPEEYSGLRVSPDTEPVDHGAERAGHIPGALSLPVLDLLDERGLLRPVAEIRARTAELGIDGAAEIIAYCRLSHRAALGWLVFTELLGDHRVRVYDGSWTEWGSLVGAPVES